MFSAFALVGLSCLGFVINLVNSWNWDDWEWKKARYQNMVFNVLCIAIGMYDIITWIKTGVLK